MDNENIPFGYNDDGKPNIGNHPRGTRDSLKWIEERNEKERKERELIFNAPTEEQAHYKVIKERRKRNEQ